MFRDVPCSWFYRQPWWRGYPQNVRLSLQHKHSGIFLKVSVTKMRVLFVRLFTATYRCVRRAAILVSWYEPNLGDSIMPVHRGHPYPGAAHRIQQSTSTISRENRGLLNSLNVWMLYTRITMGEKLFCERSRISGNFLQYVAWFNRKYKNVITQWQPELQQEQ